MTRPTSKAALRMDTLHQHSSGSNNTDRKAILVLGMHRSGTSAVTRVINLLGADLPKALMSPAEDENDTGFWESVDIYRLNDDILHSAGSSWDDWCAFNPDWLRSPRSREHRRRAREILKTDFSSSGFIVIKDPRICRILPFWLDVLRSESFLPHCVIPVRNPVEVALSLRKRNGFSAPKSNALWLRHVLDAEQGSRALPRAVITYDGLLNDWHSVAASMSERLAIGWPRMSASSGAEIDRFLQDRFRHHSVADSLLNDNTRIADWVKLAYASLIELTRNQESESALQQLDGIRREFDAATAMFGSILHESELSFDESNAVLRRQIQEKSSAIARLEESSDIIRRQIQEKDTAFTQLEESSDVLRRQIAENEATIAKLDRINSDLTIQQKNLESAAKEKGELLESLHANRSELSASLAREEERSEAIQKELHEIVYALNERQSGAAWPIAQRLHRLENKWPGGLRFWTSVPKALWWTVSLQLPEQIRKRREIQLILKSGLFDESWYVAHNRDSVLSGYRPIIHWMLIGCKEGRDPNAFFDTDWYLQQYPDVAQEGINPLYHYIARGASQGYDPGPRFNTSAYLTKNPGLVGTDVNPLAHMLSSMTAGVYPGVDGGAQGRGVVLIEPSSRRQLAEQIAFPESMSPLVSIIIPVYNHVDLTLQCLESIIGCGARSSFEVIVIDDYSTDETEALLSQIDGLRYVRNGRNLGFTLSCNRGASLARGTYLVFLNNDTVVNDGWLDELVETVSSQPNAGMIGAKLVYPTGRMQEAGGLIWKDGSGCNVGRDDDPNKPQYNYLREVDYCSGACILIERDLFDKVGGFDERYAPAYYEDTDLAFKVREQGLRVLYQPLSVVTHHEGGTAGTDLTQGAKRYQVSNQAKFLDRWRAVLDRHGDPSHGIGLAKDRWVAGRALVIDVWPTPDRDSGSIDAVNLLNTLLAYNYKVTFLPANTFSHFGAYTSDLQRRGVECIYSPFCSSIEHFLESEGIRPDVVFLRRVEFGGKYLELVRRHCPKATVIFDTVDLHYLRELRRAEVEQSWELRISAEAKREMELSYVRQSDATIVVSEFEKTSLEREVPGANVWWMPFSRDIPGRTSSFSERSDVLFVGGFLHQPNVDAVKYFVEEIWPFVVDRLPQARFFIIGSNMPQEFNLWASPNIIPVGYAKSLTPHFAHCRLSVAPLRYGAGIKGKIVTSMSHGVPVIATPLAVEGMGCTVGDEVLVGEEASAFAEAIITAYTNEELWTRLSDNGLALVSSLYSHQAGGERLAALLRSFQLPAHEAPRQALVHSRRDREISFKGVTANPLAGAAIPSERQSGRIIAFYLPQFHPIPENDLWWGKGFTEWSNVTKARPLFPGHYQPHLPSELGFYDLRVPEVREAQASLAREYGISGFCYYHYWFSGKRLLERPFNEVLASGSPDFPFCLCWANENWTRRWDGRENQVLMQQSHTPENDRRFFSDILPALRDERYIRVNGKPLLLVYRTELLPDPKRTAEIWREESIRAGLGGLYLCRAESFADSAPDEVGFDAAYEFPPLNVSVSEIRSDSLFPVKGSDSSGVKHFRGKIFPYDELVEVMCNRDAPKYKRFRGAMVAWDNTARRNQDAYLWLRSTPELFEHWVRHCLEDTRMRFSGDEQIVFVNAWNEWAEGCHLEPDQRYGRRYLEAVLRSIGGGDAIDKAGASTSLATSA